MALVIMRRVGEEILIGEGENLVIVKPVGWERGRVRLSVQAPRHIPVDRREIRYLKERGVPPPAKQEPVSE